MVRNHSRPANQKGLRLLKLEPEEVTIGEAIIGNLDERGYLAEPVDALAASLDTTPEQVENVLVTVQGLEPPGIAARDLRETLLEKMVHGGRPELTTAADQNPPVSCVHGTSKKVEEWRRDPGKSVITLR